LDDRQCTNLSLSAPLPVPQHLMETLFAINVKGFLSHCCILFYPLSRVRCFSSNGHLCTLLESRPLHFTTTAVTYNSTGRTVLNRILSIVSAIPIGYLSKPHLSNISIHSSILSFLASYFLQLPRHHLSPSSNSFKRSHSALPSQLSFALPMTALIALLALPFHLLPISGTSSP